MLVKDLKGKRGFYRTAETAQVNRTLKFRRLIMSTMEARSVRGYN